MDKVQVAIATTLAVVNRGHSGLVDADARGVECEVAQQTPEPDRPDRVGQFETGCSVGIPQRLYQDPGSVVGLRPMELGRLAKCRLIGRGKRTRSVVLVVRGVGGREDRAFDRVHTGRVEKDVRAHRRGAEQRRRDSHGPGLLCDQATLDFLRTDEETLRVLLADRGELLGEVLLADLDHAVGDSGQAPTR